MSGTPEERIAKFSGKHAPNLLFIVDEGDAVPDEVYTGIEGCMSGGNARLLIMFNPKMRAGSCYRKEVEAKANVIHVSALNHPNVVTGKNVFPGAVDRETTARRINDWTRVISSGEIGVMEREVFEVPDYLVGYAATALNGEKYAPLTNEKRRIINQDFYYMVKGEYPEHGEQQLISEEWILAARSRYDLYVSKYGNSSPADMDAVAGFDVAEFGGDSNVVCARYGGFTSFSAWAGIDVDASSIKLFEHCMKLSVNMVIVDATGIGAGIAPSLVRQARAKNWKDLRAFGAKIASSPSGSYKSPEGEFFQLRDQLWWMCREWLKSDVSMLPNIPRLLDELRAPQYSKTTGGKIKITDKNDLRQILKRSTDYADALCLTFLPVARPKMIRLE